MRTRKLRGLVGHGVAGLLLAGALPGTALGNDTCNGFINIDYVGAPPITAIGDTVELEITFGTGTIQGGTKMTIESFQMNMDCNATFPLTPPCTDEGPIIQYEGDGEIISNCPGVAWSTGHGIDVNPNEVIFTATPPLDIPANQPTLPGFCSVRFKVRVLGASIDGSGKIEQLVGYQKAVCDNGVLLSGGFQTSAIETPPPLHFSCYEVVRGNIPDIAGVTLEDRFGSTTATLIDVKRLCAPTDKNGESPGAEAAPDHLLAYTVKTTAGTWTKPKGVTIANQFGLLKVDVVSPVFLKVPTAKSLVPPPPPPLVGSMVPHFQCYKLSNVKNNPDNKGINLLDQFGPLTLDLDKRGPFRLCVPVNKNGEDPGAKDDPSVLLCYNTRNDKLPFGDKVIHVGNQFGPFTGKITQYDELCVPSVIVP